MKIKLLFVTVFAVGALGACENQYSLTARDNGGSSPESGKDDGKNENPKPGKVHEKFGILQFQPPTLDEADFLNTMGLDFAGYDQAYFTFSHAPDEDGSLYFSMAQARLHFQSCTKSANREFDFRIVWQEVQNNKRVIVKEFSPDITEFEFKKGKRYFLTYALTDLKQVADCKAAKLSFATFLKNYKK